tara:strand:- start:202 stop:396 length:195 start_codon:yes stop_codon:yes gene_type:complete
MESLFLAWGESQSWWATVCSIIVIANAVTLAVKDEYAEKLPVIGKIWPIMNWLALNVHNNKNAK